MTTEQEIMNATDNRKNEIQELERRVQELKLLNEYEKLMSDFNNAKENIGKAFASKGLKFFTLGRYTKLNNLRLIKISEVYLGDEYNEERINSFEDYKRCLHRNEIRPICVGETIYISIVDNRHNFSITEMKGHPHRILGFCQEIKLETYNNLRNIISNSIDSILCEPIKDIKNTTEYAEPDRVSVLKERGYDFIEISTDEEYALCNHPFVYFNRLLNTELSRDIIKDFIKEEQRLDALDKDYYFAGERIKRIGNHAKHINILNNLLDRMISNIK